MKQFIEEAIKEINDYSETLYSIFDKISDKAFEEGYELLSQGEKDLYGLDLLLREVNNGGFDQYFFNTDGLYAEKTLAFLNTIEAFSLADMLQESLSIYHSSSSDDEKLDAFDEIDQRFYNDLDYDVLYKACIAYIKNHLDEFK